MFLKTTEYALRAVIYIAQKSSEEKKLGLAQIAKAIDSPQSFTAKILQQLTSGNKIISSTRGPNGGFYITEKSKKLPVYAILAAMGEGEILKKCVLGLKQCSEAKPCPMHHQYKLIKPQLIRMFETKTISDLANEIESGTSYIGNKK
jgi:Rrf2 family transcriptional regulator, iron-sulfur cluster assembly transcription factor